MNSYAPWTSHEDRYLLDRCPSPGSMPWLDEEWFRARGIDGRAMNAAQVMLRHGKNAAGVDRTALISSAGRWTYAELDQHVGRLASCLRRTLGVRPGSGVVLQFKNGPWAVVSFLAILRVGGVAILCSSLLTSAEMIELVERTRAHLWIGDAEGLDGASVPARYISIRSIVEIAEQLTSQDDEPFVQTAPTDPALILFSSGSTGKPKPCVHFHRELIVVSETYGRDILPISAGDIAVSSSAFSFAYGLESSILMPLYHGAATIVLEESSPMDILDAIEAHQATHLYSVPAIYRAMVRLASRFDLRSLKACVSAGESISADLIDLWRKQCGIPITDGLGSSEFNCFILGARPDEARVGATGPVIPGFEAKVLGDDGAEAPTGEVGRLAVRGPTGCKYFDSPDDQSRQILSGWTLTGDVCTRDVDGFYWHHGRADSLVNRGGIKISTIEIERVLQQHPDVVECAVVGAFDAKHQTSLIKAFVSLKREAVERETATSLRSWLRQRLAQHKIPDAIIRLADLPRNPNGKIVRSKLLEDRPAS